MADFFFECVTLKSELCMALQHSGIVFVQRSGLTESILSVMIHWLCVSNEEIDYMWLPLHLLVNEHICLHVLCGNLRVYVCVEYIAGERAI